MKKGIISKSLLLSFIGVLLCISMFVGTTLALFNFTIKSEGNKVITSAASVKFTFSDTYGAEGTDLNGTKLFDNVFLSPGEITATKYITITNGSSHTVNVDIVIDSESIDISESSVSAGRWKLYSKIISNPDELGLGTENCRAFSELFDTNYKLVKNTSVISIPSGDNNTKTIAVAIGLDSNSVDLDDSVTFSIIATATEQSS